MSQENENAIPAEFDEDAPQPGDAEQEQAQQAQPEPEPATASNVPAKRDPMKFGGAKVGGIIPTNSQELMDYAKFVAAAGWAPKGYLKNHKQPNEDFSAAKIAMGMAYGMELGFSPLAALRVVAVINGMPSVWGDGMLSLCQSTGLMEDFHEEEIIAEADGDGFKKGACIGYICTVKRRGVTRPTVAKFTREDAVKAGLLGKDGPWKQYPRRMYQMRARSWALRTAFSDRLNNMMIYEEAIDAIEGEAFEVATPAAQIENKPAVNIASKLDAFASTTKEPVGVAAKKGQDVGNDPNAQG